MKLKLIATSLLIGAMLIPAFAQDTTATQEADTTSEVHTLTWDRYSFSYPDALVSHVNLYWTPAGGTEGDAYTWPNSITFDLSNMRDDVIATDRVGTIVFYDTADLADEQWYSRIASRLKPLLDERPDLSSYEGATTMNEGLATLPYLAFMNAATVLIAQTEYIETDSFTGIGYVMIGRQSIGPFRADEPLYIFQGLSHDGSAYVSITIPLVTTVFPAEPEFEEMFDNAELFDQLQVYLKESFTTIDTATADQFAPNLGDVKALIQTITVK